MDIVPGFISIERFENLTNPGKLLLLAGRGVAATRARSLIWAHGAGGASGASCRRAAARNPDPHVSPEQASARHLSVNRAIFRLRQHQEGDDRRGKGDPDWIPKTREDVALVYHQCRRHEG